MKPLNPGVKLTLRRFRALPRRRQAARVDRRRVLRDAVPNIRHQQISGDLFALIWTYLEAHPIGRVFHALRRRPLQLRHRGARPALRFERASRGRDHAAARSRRARYSCGDWLASTRKRDETIKRRLHERMGVSEYSDCRSRDRCHPNLQTNHRAVRSRNRASRVKQVTFPPRHCCPGSLCH